MVIIINNNISYLVAVSLFHDFSFFITIICRDAWKACEGMDTNEAMQKYLELVVDINPEWNK